MPWILLPIVFVAFVSEAMSGFGATIITVTLAAHLLDVHQILALFLPVNVGMSLWLTMRNRSRVDTGILLRRVAPWMGAGFLGGVALGRLGEDLTLKAMFGALVLALAVWELWRMRRAAEVEPLPEGRARVALVGAGVVHGLYSTGGPLVVYVLGRELADKGRFRATLSAIWLVLNSALVGVYVWGGRITAETLGHSAWLVPGLLAGGAVGEALHHRLPMGTFRRWVFWMLAFGGGSLLVRTVGAMR